MSLISVQPDEIPRQKAVKNFIINEEANVYIDAKEWMPKPSDKYQEFLVQLNTPKPPRPPVKDLVVLPRIKKRKRRKTRNSELIGKTVKNPSLAYYGILYLFS